MPLKKAQLWWVLFVSTTATSLFLVDTTILPVAIPVIEKELNFSQVGVIWVVNSYLLSLTMLLLVGGRLCEIWGYRLIYNLGLVIFCAGSLLGALTHSDWGLITARTLQGVGSGLTYPASLALIIEVFPLHMRARAIGIDTGIASLFMMLGPVIGGALTEYLNWRYIFWFNLPFGIFGIIASFWLLKKGEKKEERFPYIGTLLMMAGVFFLIYGLMQGNQYGWDSFWTIASIILSPIFLLLFVLLSLHTKHPLAEFRFFKNPLFVGTNLCRICLYILLGATVLWVIYFERELDYSPLEIGALIVLGCLPVIVMAPIGGYLADHFGYRLPLTVGFVLVMLGMAWLIIFSSTKNVLVFLPGLLAFGTGMPMVMSPTIALGLSCCSAQKLGSATGLMMTLRQFSSTIGIALMTAVYYSVHKHTGNYAYAFAAIGAVALFFAAVGFFISLLLIKKQDVHHLRHSHSHPHP